MGMTPEYLLGLIDSNGERRPEPPTIVRGDAELLKRAIASCPHKHTYTSGVLMDEKPLKELGGHPFLETLMDDFQKTMLPGMPDDAYVMIFVIHHRRDSKLELNYCIANLHLPSGRSLTPYYHKSDCKRFQLFVEQQNLTHGMSNPNAPGRRKTLITNPKDSKERKEGRQLIHRTVEKAVEAGHVYDRESLLRHLKLVYTINRAGRDSVTVRTSDDQLYRMKGAYYSRDYDAGKPLPAMGDDEAVSADRLRTVTQRLNELCAMRADYFRKKYYPEPKQEEKPDGKESVRAAARQRIRGAAGSIIDRAQTLLRALVRRKRIDAPRHRGTDGQPRRIGAENQGRDAAPLARGHHSGRSGDHPSRPEDRVLSPVADPRRAGLEQTIHELPPALNRLSLFARFFRIVSRRVHRLSGRGDTARETPEVLQDHGGEQPER